MSEYEKPEFSYRRNGVYERPTTSAKFVRRATVAKNARREAKCPGCGMLKINSVACFCW